MSVSFVLYAGLLNYFILLLLLLLFIMLLLLVGRLCQNEETVVATNIRESCQSEAEYFNALSALNCSSGEPGKIVWTPDDSTPNTVYYQVT